MTSVTPTAEASPFNHDCCCRCACCSSIRLSVKTCWNQFLHQVYITQSNECMPSYPSGVYAVCLFIPLYLTNREMLKDCCAAAASRIYSQFPGKFTLSALHPTAKSGLWKLIQPNCFVSNILFPNVLLQLWIHMQTHNPNLRIICNKGWFCSHFTISDISPFHTEVLHYRRSGGSPILRRSHRTKQLWRKYEPLCNSHSKPALRILKGHDGICWWVWFFSSRFPGVHLLI